MLAHDYQGPMWESQAASALNSIALEITIDVLDDAAIRATSA